MNFRFDNKGYILIKGERQRKNGTYEYRITVNGNRVSIYAKTLPILRRKVWYTITGKEETDKLMEAYKREYGPLWAW